MTITKKSRNKQPAWIAPALGECARLNAVLDAIEARIEAAERRKSVIAPRG